MLPIFVIRYAPAPAPAPDPGRAPAPPSAVAHADNSQTW